MIKLNFFSRGLTTRIGNFFETKKRIVRLWDFDGVLFVNPENNYYDEYLILENIVTGRMD